MNPFIDVRKIAKSSDQLGKVRAKIGMDTNFGRISSISGNILTIGSGTTQGRFRIYAWDNVNIDYNQATGFYSFPTGTECLVNGHHTQFPKPEPSGQVNFTTYLKNGGSLPQSYNIGG